jgi:uncharacterized membrane protein
LNPTLAVAGVLEGCDSAGRRLVHDLEALAVGGSELASGSSCSFLLDCLSAIVYAMVFLFDL